jgi:hypothetical protein
MPAKRRQRGARSKRPRGMGLRRGSLNVRRGPGADGMPVTRLRLYASPDRRLDVARRRDGRHRWHHPGRRRPEARPMVRRGHPLDRGSAGAGELWLDLFQSSLHVGRGLADGRRPGDPGLCRRDRGIRNGPLDVRRRLAPWHGAVQCGRCWISHGRSKIIVNFTTNRPATISVQAESANGSLPRSTGNSHCAGLRSRPDDAHCDFASRICPSWSEVC